MVWQDFNKKVFRFAVLKHVRDSDTHWDLMLQMPEKELLATWQFRLDPSLWTGSIDPIPALQLPDHRTIYLDYEGEISDGRGQVARVDGGAMELLRCDVWRINFILHGRMLQGPFTITSETRGTDHPPERWQLKAGAT